MARQAYKTISDELVDCADAVFAHLDRRGYVISIEKHEIGFPFLPVFLCKRGHTTLVVEVTDRIVFDRLTQWTAYRRSADRDMQLVVVVPSTLTVSASDEGRLRQEGVGL